MLLSAVMCAKPLCHRNVNIKLYITQIYVNTIIHRQFTVNPNENDVTCQDYNGVCAHSLPNEFKSEVNSI
jgi:hypothetical protein